VAIEITQQPKDIVISGNQSILSVIDEDVFDFTTLSVDYGKIVFIWFNSGLVAGNTINFYGHFAVDVKAVDNYGGLDPYINRLFDSYALHGGTPYEYLEYMVEAWNKFIYFPDAVYVYVGEYGGHEGIFVLNTYGGAVRVQPLFTANVEIVEPADPIIILSPYKFKYSVYEIIDNVSSLLSSVLFTADAEDTDAIFDYDISDFLFKEQTGHFTLLTASDKFIVHDILSKINVVISNQLNDDPNNITSSARTDDFYVLQGKVPDLLEAQQNELSKTIYDYLADNKKFLSLAPTTKITDIYTPERLYWAKYLGIPTVAVFTIYYTDSTSDVENRANSLTDDDNKVIEINTSFQALTFNENKVVDYYEVYLKDVTDTKISETRTYQMSYKYQKYARYFLFLNKLGVYDVFRTTGKLESDINVAKQFITVEKPNNYTEDYRNQKQIDQLREYSAVLNTGHLQDRSWAIYSLELIESSDVYWLKYGKAYPVTIPGEKINFSEDGEYLQNIPFPLNLVNPEDELYNDFDFDPAVPLAGDFNFDFREDYY